MEALFFVYRWVVLIKKCGLCLIEKCGLVVFQLSKNGAHESFADESAAIGYAVLIAEPLERALLLRVEQDTNAIFAWHLLFSIGRRGFHRSEEHGKTQTCARKDTTGAINKLYSFYGFYDIELSLLELCQSG